MSYEDLSLRYGADTSSEFESADASSDGYRVRNLSGTNLAALDAGEHTPFPGVLGNPLYPSEDMYTDSLGTRHGLHGDDRSSPLPASLPGDSTQPLANAAEGDGPENLLSNIVPGEHDLSQMAFLQEDSRDRSRDLGSASTGSPGGSSEADDFFVRRLQRGVPYELMPESGKVVVLNTHLSILKAFRCLVEHNVRSAPLWDPELGNYVGLLTVSDFIEALRTYYESPYTGLGVLADMTVKQWREEAGKSDHLIYVNAESDLLSVCEIFLSRHIHRLPLVEADTNTILTILTHSKLLEYLSAVPGEKEPEYLSQSVAELGIGSYRSIATVTMETPIIVVLDVFLERKISAVPVIDERGKLINVYTKADVYELARRGAFDNLDITVEESLSFSLGPNYIKRPLYACRKSATLREVCNELQSSRVHRLICIDSTHCVVGVISLSDILRYLARVDI